MRRLLAGGTKVRLVSLHCGKSSRARNSCKSGRDESHKSCYEASREDTFVGETGFVMRVNFFSMVDVLVSAMGLLVSVAGK